MPNHPQPYPNISVQHLLERQLADWHHLLNQLLATGAPAEQIEYCRQ